MRVHLLPAAELPLVAAIDDERLSTKPFDEQARTVAHEGDGMDSSGQTAAARFAQGHGLRAEQNLFAACGQRYRCDTAGGAHEHAVLEPSWYAVHGADEITDEARGRACVDFSRSDRKSTRLN